MTTSRRKRIFGAISGPAAPTKGSRTECAALEEVLPAARSRRASRHVAGYIFGGRISNAHSYFFFSTGAGAGTSELKMSAAVFQLPSACFFHTSTILPRSSCDLPCGFFAAIR